MTQLSVLGVPGVEYTYAPKVPPSGKAAGPFTALQVTATPGGIPTYNPKDPAIPSGKASGPFTVLSPMGTPIGLYVYAGKTETEIVATKRGSGGAKSTTRRYVIQTPEQTRIDATDDEDVLFILSMAIAGLIDEI